MERRKYSKTIKRYNEVELNKKNRINGKRKRTKES